MEKQSLEEFLRKWGIEGRVTRTSVNYAEDAKVNGVTYKQGRVEFKLDGAGFKADIHWPSSRKDPSLHELLGDLRGMALAVDNAADFEAWAKDLGYSEDSRQAEARYYTHERKARALERWLGTGRYRELLWETKENK